MTDTNFTADRHTLCFENNVGQVGKSTLAHLAIATADTLFGFGAYSAAVVDEKYRTEAAADCAWLRRVGPENVFTMSADSRVVRKDASKAMEHHDHIADLMMAGNLVLDLGAGSSRGKNEWAEGSGLAPILASVGTRVDQCVVTKGSAESLNNALGLIGDFDAIFGSLNPKRYAVLNDVTNEGFATVEAKAFRVACERLGVRVFELPFCVSKMLPRGLGMGLTALDVFSMTDPNLRRVAARVADKSDPDDVQAVAEAKKAVADTAKLREAAGLKTELSFHRDRTDLGEYLLLARNAVQQMLFEGLAVQQAA